MESEKRLKSLEVMLKLLKIFKTILSYQSVLLEIRNETTTWEKREKRKTWLNKIAGL